MKSRKAKKPQKPIDWTKVIVAIIRALRDIAVAFALKGSVT